MYVNAEALLRSLPDIPEVLAKLKSGEYRLWGGVVRHAAGTKKGGQIVGHLLVPGDSSQAQESLQKLQATLEKGLGSLQGGIDHLQQNINVLQGLQVANLALSGLNLAVTAAGFVIVCKKLNNISNQIQAQSHKIAKTLQIVGEIQEQKFFEAEAQFRSLILAAGQFCEQGDVEHLKSLIAPFHKEYQFTKLILEKHASIANSNVERLGEIELLQGRLVNLGLMMSHVQIKAGAVKHGRECIQQLSSDLTNFSTKRIEALCVDRSIASTAPQSRLSEVKSFLQNGKAMLLGLEYQADVIDLEIRYPGLLERSSESNDILLLAA